MRSRAAKPKENLYKASLQTKLRYDTEAAVADDFPRDLPTKLNGTASTNKSLFSKLNPFKRKIPHEVNLMKRHSIAPGQVLDPQKYLRNTMNGRASVSSLSKNYLTENQNRRPSMFPSCEEEQDLLETTTVADLIRAIEMVHTDNAMSELPDMLSSKKTKNAGTAHLTPPRYPSLLTLERPSASNTMHGSSSDIVPFGRNRIYSCVGLPGETPNSRGRILGDANIFNRRPSTRPPPPYTTTPTDSLSSLKPALKRRFSVRPANLDKAPGQSHSLQNSQLTAAPAQQPSNSSPFQRKLSWRPLPSSLAQSRDAGTVTRQKNDSTGESATKGSGPK